MIFIILMLGRLIDDGGCSVKKVLIFILSLMVLSSVWVSCEKSPVTKAPKSTLIPVHEKDDKTITQELASEMKIAYSDFKGGHYPPQEYSIIRYYGNYSGCDVVFIHFDSVFLVETILTPFKVGKYIIEFPHNSFPYVYSDGNFYTLTEAYENGLITEEDAYEIGTKVDSTFKKRYPTPITD